MKHCRFIDHWPEWITGLNARIMSDDKKAHTRLNEARKSTSMEIVDTIVNQVPEDCRGNCCRTVLEDVIGDHSSDCAACRVAMSVVLSRELVPGSGKHAPVSCAVQPPFHGTK